MTVSTDEPSQDGQQSRAGSGAWAPFRSRDFARMASAQFVSNVGGWMQTVGAQELMLSLTTSATLVALIQTAAGLPIVLLTWSEMSRVGICWLGLRAAAGSGWPWAATVGQTDIRGLGPHDW